MSCPKQIFSDVCPDLVFFPLIRLTRPCPLFSLAPLRSHTTLRADKDDEGHVAAGSLAPAAPSLGRRLTGTIAKGILDSVDDDELLLRLLAPFLAHSPPTPSFPTIVDTKEY